MLPPVSVFETVRALQCAAEVGEVRHVGHVVDGNAGDQRDSLAELGKLDRVQNIDVEIPERGVRQCTTARVGGQDRLDATGRNELRLGEQTGRNERLAGGCRACCPGSCCSS